MGQGAWRSREMTVQAQGRSWCKKQFRCTWGEAGELKDSFNAEDANRMETAGGLNPLEAGCGRQGLAAGAWLGESRAKLALESGGWRRADWRLVEAGLAVWTC